jgi:hypothetical protein
MRALSLAFLVTFFGFAVLPMTVRLLHLFPGTLDGVVADVTNVPFAWKAYFGGEFQQPFESSFDSEIGLRPQAVRVDNELNYRVFGQLGYDPHTSIVLGKDDYIFDRVYVDSFNRHDEVPATEIEARVQRMLLLQQHMLARGSAFLFLITPSKAELYPEYLPEDLVDKARQQVPRNYDKLKPLLDRYGIQYFDAHAFLAGSKSAVPFTWFQNTGIHWNDPAVCEVTANVLERLQEQLHRPLSQLGCKPYRVQQRPRIEDIDVLRVCNLLWPERLERPAYYAKPRVSGRGANPSVLIIGGSFNRPLIRYLDRAHVRDTYLFYYYAKLEHRGRSQPLPRATLDFEHNVFNKDVVILEANLQVMSDIGFGFLEDAERAILKSRAPN